MARRISLHMERVARSRRAVLALVLALAGCGSPPPTHFHSLMPAELVVRAPAATADLAGIPILLDAVHMPVQVEQPQWLVRLPDDSAALLEQERWASPLPDEFRGALLEQLVAGHGAIDARTLPPPAPPSWRITIDVRRFDSLAGREARIEGSWTLQGTGSGARAASSRCEWLFREDAAGGMPALAAAHRRALARLADAIATMLARVARGESGPCPATSDRG